MRRIILAALFLIFENKRKHEERTFVHPQEIHTLNKLIWKFFLKHLSIFIIFLWLKINAIVWKRFFFFFSHYFSNINRLLRVELKAIWRFCFVTVENGSAQLSSVFSFHFCFQILFFPFFFWCSFFYFSFHFYPSFSPYIEDIYRIKYAKRFMSVH